MPDLKDCPFCGGKAGYMYDSDVGPNGERAVIISCGEHQLTSIHLNKESAADEWNTRVADPQVEVERRRGNDLEQSYRELEDAFDKYRAEHP